jgi:SAM-dependent methyltransferase
MSDVERRFTFNQVAQLYDAARPSYPDALFNDCIREAGLKSGDRMLEVGAGTGKATEGFARRGLSVLALEPGAQMIATAKQSLAPYRNIAFVESTFEAWTPEPQPFGLVAAAQAWHWVDPAIGFRKAGAVLRDGGWLSIFGNVPMRVPEDLDRAFAKTSEHHVPGSHYSVPGMTAAYLPTGVIKASIDASGLFGPVVHKGYAWKWRHTTASFLDNQRTLSEFRMMTEEKRERFLADIAAAIDAHGGVFDMDIETHLYMARKKP